MAIDFPTSPTTGQQYTFGNKTYTWDGEKWVAAWGYSGRRRLTANTTLYVRTDGSDLNDGSANDSSHAFATVQGAFNYVAGALDLNGYDVTIQVGAGTYTDYATINGPWFGMRGAGQNSTVLLQGDTTTPANVVLQGTVTAGNGASLNIAGFRLESDVGNYLLLATNHSEINIIGKMEFGGTNRAADICANYMSYIYISGNADYSIDGATLVHLWADNNSCLQLDENCDIALLSPSPDWSSGAFVQCTHDSFVMATGLTVTGSGTGRRFWMWNGGCIRTGNSSLTYFPGDTNGVLDATCSYNLLSGVLATQYQDITGGASVTVYDIGTRSSGSYAPNPGIRPMQKYTNAGAHTLAPGTVYGNYILDILNTTGAGAITTSGWTKVSGDSFDTTTTSKFRCYCSVTADYSLLQVTKIA